MEFLRFIFSSFWIWLGFIILIGTIGIFIVYALEAIFSNSKSRSDNEQKNQKEDTKEIGEIKK
ncbi:MAG: hypothetical protein NC548_15995 [Lachnospiraceae bacterium]|nr:hypothetical protein [Lachnospiraceae bacterium]